MKYKKITSNSGLISFGNTGARMSDPRAVYAEFLKVLAEFREKNLNWNESDQQKFAQMLREKGILKTSENTIVGQAKDVRVKTGFLSEFGFTTDKRMITNAGKELLKNAENYITNEFEISQESFIYFKQFLKFQQSDFEVIPLLSLIYSVLEFNNEMPLDFLTYVWAACKTKKELVENIEIYKKYGDYRKVVYKNCVNSENTKIAKENINDFLFELKFSDTQKLKELLYAILPHGKGNSFKDKTIELFYDLKKYWKNKNNWKQEQKQRFILEKLKPKHKEINCKKSTDYLLFLFNTAEFNKKTNWENVIVFFENTDLLKSINESNFILNFHLIFMFFKKLSVCFEYQDLNLRHLKLLDIFIVEYQTVKLDLLFFYLFKSVKNDLLNVKLLSKKKYKENLEKIQQNISEIYDFLQIDIYALTEKIAEDYKEVKTSGLKNFVFKQKEKRLENLVNKVFTKQNLIIIFENIYPRNDNEIRKLIKEWYSDYDATIPALFEYLLGISFYWLSERQVNLSDILNTNLDANLLPRSTAIGGKSDVVISCNTKDYLIEATLSENDNQRKMEAEPVPRHLARHILENNPNALLLFVAGQLDLNNLVVLRNYKFSKWYSPDGNQVVDFMNILPLTVQNIIFLLKSNINFTELETLFENLVNSQTRDGFEWYKNEVNQQFV
ncbi:MAG: AlwI family type II restriction endonuclease [Prevotellaceae bacterium]|jgi:hypothetical protein|nr:AlwI family type II restriction endonuclease [Prevotellaceae bacterium]